MAIKFERKERGTLKKGSVSKVRMRELREERGTEEECQAGAAAIARELERGRGQRFIDLNEAGPALYGSKAWMSRLAADMGVTPQAVRNWTSDSHVPLHREDELKRLLRERRDRLNELLGEGE